MRKISLPPAEDGGCDTSQADLSSVTPAMWYFITPTPIARGRGFPRVGHYILLPRGVWRAASGLLASSVRACEQCEPAKLVWRWALLKWPAWNLGDGAPDATCTRRPQQFQTCLARPRTTGLIGTIGRLSVLMCGRKSLFWQHHHARNCK